MPLRRPSSAACQQHPEWQLRWFRYDGGDPSLLGLSGLLRAAGNAGPLPALLMRRCLIALVRQILKNEDKLAGRSKQRRMRARTSRILPGAARPVHGLRPPATLHRSADMPALTFAQINALA